jgi:BirA family biotin operon repressor/biotin-[acetyl-CoA-carboxylase] ligase
LLSRLGTTRIVGREIRVFERTTSTNDIIARLGRDGIGEGAVVFAESQSRGRGRLGRLWVSPARKGLWFSILLRPDLAPQSATQLTVAAATALARAIALQTGLAPEIKWPNDILIRGKKAAGILTEMTAELDHVKEMVLGIGVNVNLDAAELPPDLRKTATSLKIESGQVIDRAELAVVILRELDEDYERIRRGQFELVAAEWQQRCGTLGRQVAIRIGERVIRGRAESLDAEGALLLRTQHGRLERIIGGDVTMEKDAG